MEGARLRQCVGKVKLLSQERANAEAKILHKRFKARFTGYLCPHCHYFHVGTHRSKEAAIRGSSKRSRNGVR